jgi:hypothetical protein
MLDLVSSRWLDLVQPWMDWPTSVVVPPTADEVPLYAEMVASTELMEFNRFGF